MRARLPQRLSRRTRALGTLVPALALACAASACGGSQASGGGAPGASSTGGGTQSAKPNGAPLTVMLVDPFSGPDATFGLHAAAGCLAATNLINKSGGVLGHPLKCENVDTKGDPADAVPVVEKALATTSNILGALGPTSDEASAVAPIINSSGLPFFATTGQAQFDKSTMTYFHRLTPPDSIAGVAMALWAHHLNVSKAAIVVGNDIGSQGTVNPIKTALAKLGSPRVVSDQVITLDAPSYETEVARVIASKAQVILTEEDPQTAGTFFSELKQQLGSAPFPTVIGANPILVPEWYTSVSAAIGKSLVLSNFVAENTAGAASGQAWSTFEGSLLAVAQSQPALGKFTTHPTVESEYDAVNLLALSALKTHSTDPKTINSAIIPLANGTSGATNVLDFAQGRSALQSGHAIRYIGVTGPIYFNAYHNASTGIEIEHFGAGGAAVPNAASRSVITAQELAALQ